MCFCAANDSGQYVRQLPEPAFTAVPAAVDIPALFQSALHILGTLPFPVPDAFCESQRLQDRDVEFYLAPVSKSGASMFSSAIHSVLCKQFPAGTEIMQAGLTCTSVCLLVHSMSYNVQGRHAACALCCLVMLIDFTMSALSYHAFH